MSRNMTAATLLGAGAVFLALAVLTRPASDPVPEPDLANAAEPAPNESASNPTQNTDGLADSVPRFTALDFNRTAQPTEISETAETDSNLYQNDRPDVEVAQIGSDTAELRLSSHVSSVLAEVQRRQLAEQWEEALNELNALYQDYDALSSFEQASLLNFYTNTLLSLEMWNEAITAFSVMLTIPDLRADITARATLSLGQLHSRVGDYEIAAGYFRAWLHDPNVQDRTQEREDHVRGLLQAVEKLGAN